MSEKAHRWSCPLTSCNGEKSSLYGDKDQAETEFQTHLKQHSIDQAIPFICSTAKWLSAFELVEA